MGFEIIVSWRRPRYRCRYLDGVASSVYTTIVLPARLRLMTPSHWRIFTDTKKPDSARRLALKLQAQGGHEFHELKVDDYHKGGHVVTFDIGHEFDDWAAVAYDVISCAQQMGHGWSISGFIEEELELISTGTSIAGIKMVSCFCPRPGTQNAK